ncbi:S ribonuclease [Pyrus ussuriensis x Pyrus communis]|uniref:S ribonuclease n=1 Tax=Pyrus ussuriensis x Pyrus communis TaxID=2448454 RepID=A0A5N5HW86_9ROSA|nr:S ribonuclease [Pyrus ussuriensis x Pyrus communis]
MENAKPIEESVEQHLEDDDDDFVDPPLASKKRKMEKQVDKKEPKAKKAKVAKKLVLEHEDPEEDETIVGPKQLAKKDTKAKRDKPAKKLVLEHEPEENQNVRGLYNLHKMIKLLKKNDDDDERTVSDGMGKVLMAKLARKCILEPFGAVLGINWITYEWSKMDG